MFLAVRGRPRGKHQLVPRLLGLSTAELLFEHDHCAHRALSSPSRVTRLRCRQCAAMSAADGRWRATNCSVALPMACRTRGSGEWVLTRPGPPGGCEGSGTGEPGGCAGSASGAGAPGGCETLVPGAAFEVPRHAKENLALAEALRAARPPVAAAWLPLAGAALLVQEGGMVLAGCLLHRACQEEALHSSLCGFRAGFEVLHRHFCVEQI